MFLKYFDKSNIKEYYIKEKCKHLLFNIFNVFNNFLYDKDFFFIFKELYKNVI